MRRTPLCSCLLLLATLGCAGGGGGGRGTPPLGSDASLGAFTASAGTLVPAFAPETTSYELFVPAGTLAIRVVPTAADARVHGITVAQDANAALPVASGTVSQPLMVPAHGASTVTVVVTAEDAATTRAYTFHVSVGNDASLARLTVTAGGLAPVFAPGTTAYGLLVPQGTATVQVVPTANDPGVHGITVAQDAQSPVPVASGAASQALTVPATGTSTVSVVVTAQDGITKRTYTLALSAIPLPDVCGTSAPVLVADTTPGFPAEPSIPAACATLDATHTVSSTTGLPGAGAADTDAIQGAIDACVASAAAPRAVRLRVNSGDAAKVAFVSGPLALKAGVTLWVDQGVTLFASQNPRDYDTTAGTPSCALDNNKGSGCKAFITAASTAASGIMGTGSIDGLGGEPMVGGFGTDANASWWDYGTIQSDAGKSFSSPRLIDVNRSQGFTLYQITLHNSPKFHVGLESDPFLVWGVTVLTPSRTTNSVGRALSPHGAPNTDGIDPYNAGNGHIVYSTISTGDDQIALKCGAYHLSGGAGTGASCRNITIAHNHFGTGHGMSIGSETNGGASDGTGIGIDGLHVYDLSIDGLSIASGHAGDVNLNGIRIKSDRSRGGIIRNVRYEDVCMRGLANPILLNPNYDSGAAGSAIPTFESVTVRNARHVSCPGTEATSLAVTLKGYDASHLTGVTLDNVVVAGTPAVAAQQANVTLGPGPVSFAGSISGTGVTVSNGVTGSDPANACLGKFVALPARE